MLRFVFILSSCSICVAGFPQQRSMFADSAYRLPEVTVSTKRFDQFSSGLSIRKVDSVTMARYSMSSLSQILNGTGTGQVSFYGPGASSISIRGTSSNHTAILWNGLNLQDMFNGGCDLSQIQAGFIDDITVQQGGSSALFGSGAIGGVIHLNNYPEYNDGVNYKISSGIGSFDSKYYGANVSYSGQKFYQVIKAYLQDAANNYPYRKNGFTDTIGNAQRNQSGIMIGEGYKSSERSQFDVYFWNQNNSQNIMTTTISKDHQSDNRNILNAGWKYAAGKTSISFRSGMNHHLLNYNYTSKYTALQYVNEAMITRRPDDKSMWNVGINFSHDEGWFPGDIHANRNLSALFVSYKVQVLELTYLYTNLRQGMVNTKLSPFTFSLGFDSKPFTLFSFRGSFSRNYRIPTFNDYYFPGAGKTDLRSEDGISSELASAFQVKSKFLSVQLEVVAFTNVIKNMIVWQPIDPVKWNPFNLGRVWARGFENNGSLRWTFGSWVAEASASYSYTLSTNEFRDPQAPETYRRQLVYIPRHKGSGTVYLSYRNTGIAYSHQYNGLRYYEQDNSRFLKSFQTGDLSVFATAKYASHIIHVNFSINNLWDTSYEVIHGYPMPLRNYQIRLQISLNHKK